MNQKTGIQIIAAFMILSMVLSSIAYFIGGNSSNTQDSNQVNNIPNDSFNVGGKQVIHSFNSIIDALQMSPPDVYAAQYVDMEYLLSTAFQPWNEQLSVNLTGVKPLRKSDVDDLYQTSTRQMYYAQLPEDDFILLSTMTPKTVVFDYIGLPSSNNQYLILLRSDRGGTYVMGEPTIYTATRDTAEAILSIIESWTVPLTAYDTFRPVLNYSDDSSEYQVVNSQVDFADLYYLGMHRNDDGSFTRTTIYQNPTYKTSAHIQELAQTGQERGFTQYEVTMYGDIMKVVLTGNFSLVSNEDIK